MERLSRRSWCVAIDGNVPGPLQSSTSGIRLDLPRAGRGDSRGPSVVVLVMLPAIIYPDTPTLIIKNCYSCCAVVWMGVYLCPYRFDSADQVIDFFVKECAEYIAKNKNAS